MAFHHSVRYALKGLARVAKEERNFRIELAAAVVVVALMFVFPLSTAERALLAVAIGSVLVLELINSVVERVIDVLKPRIHHYVEEIKDITAAAVLVASACAAAVGLLIFWPHFVTMIGA